MFIHFMRNTLFCMAPDGNEGGGNVPDPTPDPKAGKTFTQEQVDGLIADRLGRKEKSVTEALLAALGVKDPDEAKTLIAQSKEAIAATATETEKLTKERDEAKTKAEKATTDALELVAAMQKRVLDSELRIEASRIVMGKEKKDGKEIEVVSRPAFKPEAMDDVLILVDRKNIVDKDGKYEGIVEAMNALAKAKPWLLTETAEGLAAVGKGSPGAGRIIKTAGEGTTGVKPQKMTL